MKKSSTKNITTSKGSSSKIVVSKQKKTQKISKLTGSNKKVRKIVAPKSASNIKAKKTGDSQTAPPKGNKAARKGQGSVPQDASYARRSQSPKVSGIDKKKIKLIDLAQKAKPGSARKTTKSPDAKKVVKQVDTKRSKSPKKIVARRSAKKEQGSVDSKKRERSRKESSKGKTVKKQSNSPKQISKAKARIQEFTQEDHSEDDHIMSKVNKVAKNLEKLKKDKKVEHEKRAKEEGNIKNVKPKGIKLNIKPKQVKVESPSSSEVEIPLGKSTEKKKPIKQQFKGIDPQGISEEISKIIKRIEEKKKKGLVTEKKVKKERGRREKVKKEITRTGKASEYKYKLQFNPNLKVSHVCDIFEVSKMPIIKQSDIILAILELGINPDYYQLPYSPNSAMFWDDVLEYEEVKAIFQDYKGETMRKYWIILNKAEDSHKIGELIRRHKSHMDTYPSKIKCIIGKVLEYFKGEITNFDEQITALHAVKNPLKITVDPISGDTFPTTRKFENKINKRFPGFNYIEDPSEVIHPAEDTNFSQIMKELRDQVHSQEELFVFENMIAAINCLHKALPDYSEEYILDRLAENSMHVYDTYVYLNNPTQKASYPFTLADDKALRNGPGTAEYNDLLKIKSERRIVERANYLNIKV